MVSEMFNPPFLEPLFPEPSVPESIISRTQSLFRDLHSEILVAARDSFAGKLGVSDFYELPDQYVLQIDVPGIEKKALSIRVKPMPDTGGWSVLHISGARTGTVPGLPCTAGHEGRRSHTRERVCAEFKRAVHLPSDAKVRDIDAQLWNGVLTVRIPRIQATPRDSPADSQHEVPINYSRED